MRGQSLADGTVGQAVSGNFATYNAGSATTRATVTDVQATVNGVAATGNGLQASIDTPTLDLSFNVATGLTSGSSFNFSITGGGDYVGEKHLVRIEEAGRTSAVASLVDVPAPSSVSSDGEGPDDSDDGLESKPRRRGRRGGRRRSGAKAESASSTASSE